MENKTKEITFGNYKNRLNNNCDRSCFYNCSQAGSIEPQCLIKTKEQLTEEYCKENWNNDNNYSAFIAGWDARQPEIDRLKSKIDLLLRNTMRDFLKYHNFYKNDCFKKNIKPEDIERIIANFIKEKDNEK